MAADPSSTSSSVPAATGADYVETASAAYRAALQVIESVEPRVAAATRKELADQRDSLKLIASENYASPAVLLAMGTWFSDKLFGAPYAYAQPHSGIDANLVAFWAILATRV